MKVDSNPSSLLIFSNQPQTLEKTLPPIDGFFKQIGREKVLSVEKLSNKKVLVLRDRTLFERILLFFHFKKKCQQQRAITPLLSKLFNETKEATDRKNILRIFSKLYPKDQQQARIYRDNLLKLNLTLSDFKDYKFTLNGKSNPDHERPQSLENELGLDKTSEETVEKQAEKPLNVYLAGRDQKLNPQQFCDLFLQASQQNDENLIKELLNNFTHILEQTEDIVNRTVTLHIFIRCLISNYPEGVRNKAKGWLSDILSKGEISRATLVQVLDKTIRQSIEEIFKSGDETAKKLINSEDETAKKLINSEDETAKKLINEDKTIGYTNAYEILTHCIDNLKYEDFDRNSSQIKSAQELRTQLQEFSQTQKETRFALHYYYGLGVEKNFIKAYEAFDEVASSTNADATYYLGECYLEGKGIVQSEEVAVAGFQKASESQCADAYYRLAEIYLKRDKQTHAFQAFSQDANLAFSKAAELGSPEANYYIGKYLCEKNVTNPSDKADLEAPLDSADFKGTGVNYLEKAIELGNSEALLELGKCYYEGKGVDQDYIEATNLFQKAFNRGVPGSYDWLDKSVKKLA